MKIVLATLLISLASLATELPKASDYDMDPEQVFHSSAALPVPNRSELRDIPVTSVVEAFISPYRFLEPSPNEKPYQISFTQENALDWPTLLALNNQAQQAWDLSMKIYNGDEARFREDYIRARLKPEAKKAIQMLHYSVGLFLSSSMVQEFSLVNSIKCSKENKTVSCPESISREFETKNSIVMGYSEIQKKELHYPEQISIYTYVLDNLAEKHFHSLLTQVLLEFIAVGYPLNYGTYDCGGARCALQLFNRSKIILGSDDIQWTIKGYVTNVDGDQERNRLLSYVTSLLNSYKSSQEIPVISDNELKNPKLIFLRQGLTAARLINHMAATKLDCADWGLWPKASLGLIGALAQSTYQMGRNSYESVDLDTFAIRLSRVCKLPVNYVNITPGSMNRGEGSLVMEFPQSERLIQYLGGPDVISMIGGWRKLLGRQLQ